MESSDEIVSYFMDSLKKIETMENSEKNNIKAKYYLSNTMK